MKEDDKFGGDKIGPVLLGTPRSRLRLEVAFKKGVEEVIGDEEQQRARDERMGGVSVGVVAMPLVGEFVEGVVFDVPTSVTGADDGRGVCEKRREAGHPEPLGNKGFFFAVVLTADGSLFDRAHDPDLFAALRPGREPLKIPTGAADMLVVQMKRRRIGE